jgi:phosphopantetheinyl transferase
MVRVTLASVTAICQGLPAEGDQPWLGAQERQRLSGITSPRRREQFLAGRWLARHCLADMLGGDWRGYELSAPEEGRPEVVACKAGAAPACFFSISHSADWLACAVATFRVGLDIEFTARERDVAALIELTCSEAEQRQMRGLSARDLKRAFHARWSLKEAWIKQSGEPLPGMSGIPFEPCERGDVADAVVMQGDTLVVAVAPVTPAALRLSGLLADTLEVSAWRHTAG